MSKRSTASHPNFHIQLLSDKSVVLVEVPGYETEIFLPQLQHGRIALSNIIHSRQLSARQHADERAYGGGAFLTAKSSASSAKLAAIRAGNSFIRGHNVRSSGRAGRKLTTASAGAAPSGNWPQSTSGAQNAFALKLISNGNVVLVERNGYETEIFLPHICSHCVTMKRVTVNELMQCSRSRTKGGQNLSKMTATITMPAGTTMGQPNNTSTMATDNSSNNNNMIVVNPLQLFDCNPKAAGLMLDKSEQQRHQQQQPHLDVPVTLSMPIALKPKRQRRQPARQMGHSSGGGGDHRQAPARGRK